MLNVTKCNNTFKRPHHKCIFYMCQKQKYIIYKIYLIYNIYLFVMLS